MIQTVRLPIIGNGFTIAPTLSTRRVSLLIKDLSAKRVIYNRGEISKILIDTKPIIEVNQIIKFPIVFNSIGKMPFKVHSIEFYKESLYWVYTCEHSIWLYIGPWLCSSYGDTFNDSDLNAYVVGVYTACPELGMLYNPNNPHIIIVYRFHLLTKKFEQTFTALDGSKWIDNYHIAVPYPVLKLEALQNFIDGLFTQLSERDKHDLIMYVQNTSGRALITNVITNSNELRMSIEKKLGMPVGTELHSKLELSDYILTADRINVESDTKIKEINFRQIFFDER